MNKIILLTDDLYQCNLLTAYLSRNSYHVVTLNSITDWNKYTLTDEAIIISQCSWPKMTAPELVIFLKQKSNSPIIIFTSDTNNLKQAIRTIKAGAFDYLLLPLRPDELLKTVQLAFNKQIEEKTGPDNHAIKRPLVNGIPIEKDIYIGHNSDFKKAIEQVNLVAQTNYSVIVYGESGTGKEMVAKLIHEKSERRTKPFVAIDCGALTEELANSELFGHEKGAFTGALQSKKGCLEEANGGTIFLDEIANLSYSIQVALLRVLQERKIKRVGSSSDSTIDVRIIVASNEKLKDKIHSGLFREDLYYRLNEFTIDLPPLRERKEDIINLASYFIKQSNKELGKNITGCTTGVLNVLLNHDYPGNLRELKNIIRRACLVANETITIADLPENLRDATYFERTVQEEIFKEIEQKEKLNTQLSRKEATPNSLKEILQIREFELILNTLKEHKYNKSKVARILNIDRKTLYNKLASFKLKNLNLC